MYHYLFTAVTIGFERPRYFVTEPGSGTTTIEVCMVLTIGALGQRVVVQPEWLPVTAQGMPGGNDEKQLL